MTPRTTRAHPNPDRRCPWAAAALTAALASALMFGGCEERLSGTYREVGGTGSLDFKENKVYVTSILGLTFACDYEVDGTRVILEGAGGSQVYTLDGDTLDAGAGLMYAKER